MISGENKWGLREGGWRSGVGLAGSTDTQAESWRSVRCGDTRDDETTKSRNGVGVVCRRSDERERMSRDSERVRVVTRCESEPARSARAREQCARTWFWCGKCFSGLRVKAKGAVLVLALALYTIYPYKARLETGITVTKLSKLYILVVVVVFRNKATRY